MTGKLGKVAMFTGNFFWVKLASRDIIKVIVKVTYVNGRNWVTKENGS